MHHTVRDTEKTIAGRDDVEEGRKGARAGGGEVNVSANPCSLFLSAAATENSGHLPSPGFPFK